MRMRNTYLALILSLLSAAVLFAGGSQESTGGNWVSEEAESITITDYTGKKVVIPMPVNEIVVVDPDITPVIQALKAEGLITGIGKMADEMACIQPSLHSLPKVGDYTAPDIERIIELEPDVIFLSYWSPDEIDKAVGETIPIVRLRLEPEEYESNIKTVGRILGRESEADEFIDWYTGMLNDINDRVSGLSESERVRVFEFYGGENGMTQGPPYGTFGNQSPLGSTIISMAGGINIAASLEGDWIVVDTEWVITEDPDYIIRDVFASQVGNDGIGYNAVHKTTVKSLLEDIKTKSALDTTKAVLNDKVCIIDGGLRQEIWFLGVCYAARQFYPDLMKDFSPDVIHQEFLSRFMRVDYNVRERGLFIYP